MNVTRRAPRASPPRGRRLRLGPVRRDIAAPALGPRPGRWNERKLTADGQTFFFVLIYPKLARDAKHSRKQVVSLEAAATAGLFSFLFIPLVIYSEIFFLHNVRMTKALVQKEPGHTNRRADVGLSRGPRQGPMWTSGLLDERRLPLPTTIDAGEQQ